LICEIFNEISSPLFVFLNNKYLRNHGKEKKAYTGARLETNTSTIIKVYWLGRFKSEELSYLAQDQKNKKLKLYKVGGIIPLIFATETASWIKRSIDRVNRFSNPVFCDLGTPFEQLKQKIISQLPKKINTAQ
jgi:hypothetical protein